MLSELLSRSRDSSVIVGVKNFVVVMLWLPVLFILWGLGIGAAVLAVRTGLNLNVTQFASFNPSVDPTTGLLGAAAILGAIGFLYLVLMNVTFGISTVEKTQDQAEDIKDVLDD